MSEEIKKQLRRKWLDTLPIKVIFRGGEPVKIPKQTLEFVEDRIKVIIEIEEDITE